MASITALLCLLSALLASPPFLSTRTLTHDNPIFGYFLYYSILLHFSAYVMGISLDIY